MARRTHRFINTEVTQRRAVDVDMELVNVLEPGGVNLLVFNLFDDASFTGRVEYREYPATRIGYRDTIALSGIIPDYPGSSFQLVSHRGVLAADIRIPGLGEYQIRATAPGVHEAWKIDPTQYPECLTDEKMQLAPAPDQLKLNSAEASFVEDGSRIDVIILYTTQAGNLMAPAIRRATTYRGAIRSRSSAIRLACRAAATGRRRAISILATSCIPTTAARASATGAGWPLGRPTW